MSRPKNLAKSEFGAKVAHFLGLAYKDYLASRLLLNVGLLSQGSVLASTAIEKYLKAVLAFRGNEASGHLGAKHIRAAKNFDSRLASALNDQFLELLQRAYRLRYLDKLPDNFNLVIAGREFLAELDFTALMLQESFRMKVDGKEARFSYGQDKASGDPVLFNNNYVLAGVKKQDFISAEPQFVYEIRSQKTGEFLEISYWCTARSSDGNFLREGLQDRGSDHQQKRVQVALPPIYRPPDAE